MRKIGNGEIDIDELKVIDNSRLRDTSEVGDLMDDINQRGLLQNVGVRKNDNTLIYGFRRMNAFKKLGHKKIPCDFFDDVDDDDILMMNIAENIKRKNIGSIELGRMIDILKKRGYSNTEIASKLIITKGRVESSWRAFNITKDTPFGKLVVYGKLGKNKKGIPESLLWTIQNSISRAFPSNTIPSNDWEIILQAILEGTIHSNNVSILRGILLSQTTLNISRAIDILDDCKIIYLNIPVNMRKLDKFMSKHKIRNERQLLIEAIREKYSELLF